jgi:hypothetical protein
MAAALFAIGLVILAAALAQAGMIEFAPNHAVLPGGVLFVLIILYANLLAFRCSHCGANWGTLAMQGPGNLFAIDRRIRFCPFCGRDIDSAG